MKLTNKLLEVATEALYEEISIPIIKRNREQENKIDATKHKDYKDLVKAKEKYKELRRKHKESEQELISFYANKYEHLKCVDDFIVYSGYGDTLKKAITRKILSESLEEYPSRTKIETLIVLDSNKEISEIMDAIKAKFVS